MATNVGAKKRAGIVLIILGIIVLGAALLSAVTGGPPGGFSPASVLGIVVGVLIVLVGFVLIRKKGHLSEPPV